MNTSFYSRLSESRGVDSPDLEKCIFEVLDQLEEFQTTEKRPVILLGRIQGGKTRAFLGVIAAGFDRGYEMAIIFTKGTIALSSQTVARLKSDFSEDIKNKKVALFDIMSMPELLVKKELTRKLVFVSKKQTHNLDRVLKLFEQYPSLQRKRVLIVDDEADLASLRFVKSKKNKGEIEQGVISDQLDKLRKIVPALSFLQVTATGQSLFLQPDSYEELGYSYLPKKPAAKVTLPKHENYVGGSDFFGEFEETDPRSFLFIFVPEEELDTLRNNDHRSVRPHQIFQATTTTILRQSLLTFLASVALRRWQQAESNQSVKDYAMVMHCDIRKKAHSFLLEHITNILKAFTEDVDRNGGQLKSLFERIVYNDLKLSTLADGGKVPTKEVWFTFVSTLLLEQDIISVQVNSEVEMEALLNDSAELHLRTACNIFVGGNILDRGITIPNLISFYYGRNPKTMQSDTVMQHSRIYGARDRRDLAVTRFYTSKELYHRLNSIESLDEGLRWANASGANSKGVVFIQTDPELKIRPCSTDKLLTSDLITIKPSGRILPIGFSVYSATQIHSSVKKIDELVLSAGIDDGDAKLCDLSLAYKLLDLIEPTFNIEGTDWAWDTCKAVLHYFSHIASEKLSHRGKIWISSETDRKMKRERPNGRLSNAPDTKQQRDLAEKVADDLPILFLLRQNGLKDDGWSGHPFWMPVLIAPRDSTPCVFARP